MNVELSLPFQPGQEPDPRLFINLHTTPREIQQLINAAIMTKNHFLKKGDNLIIVQRLSDNDLKDQLFLHYLLVGDSYLLKTLRHGEGPCFQPIQPEEWQEGNQIVFIVFKNKAANTEKSFPLKFQNMIQSQL